MTCPPTAAALTALTAAARYFALALLALQLWRWVRREHGPPRWLARVFEISGEPSTRLVLAFVLVIVTLCMQAAGRISDALVNANYLLAGTLLGLVTASRVGQALADRAPEPGATIVNAKTVTAEVAAENVTVAPTAPPTPE